MDRPRKEIDFDVDIDIDIDIDIGNDEKTSEKHFDLPSNFIKKDSKPIKNNYIKYYNAKVLAKDIKFPTENGGRYHVLVSGSFVFGDFIEAFFVEHNFKAKELTISTLSMSLENIESLRNLIVGGYVGKLNLLLSDYFFGHERIGLIPIMYNRLNIEDVELQIAFAGVHTKCVLIETSNNNKIVMTGSANLRSSANIEFFNLENDSLLYDFHYDWHQPLIEKYQTLKKIQRGKILWHQVQKAKGVKVQQQPKENQNSFHSLTNFKGI